MMKNKFSYRFSIGRLLGCQVGGIGFDGEGDFFFSFC